MSSFKELSNPDPTTQIFHEKGEYTCADFILVEGDDLRMDTDYEEDKFAFRVNSEMSAIIVLYGGQLMWSHVIPPPGEGETYTNKHVLITKTGFAVEGCEEEIYTFDRQLVDAKTVTFRFHLHGLDTDVHSHAVIELWPSTAFENVKYPETHDGMASSFVYVRDTNLTEYDNLQPEYLNWREENTTMARLLYGRVEPDNPDYMTPVEINLSIKDDNTTEVTGPRNLRRIYKADGFFMFAVLTWYYVEYDTKKTRVHIATQCSLTTKEQDVTFTQKIVHLPIDLVLLDADGRLYDFGSTEDPTKISRAELMLIEHDGIQTVFAFAINLRMITGICDSEDVTKLLLEDPRIYDLQQTVDKDVSLVIDLTSRNPNNPIHGTNLLLCGRLPQNFKVQEKATTPSE